LECLASKWVNIVIGPEEYLKFAEKLLREAEELRDKCARTGDLMACVQAGEKAWGCLLPGPKGH